MVHVQVQILGSAPDGEVWSTGLRYSALADTQTGFEDGTMAGLTPEVLQAISDGVAALNAGAVVPSTLRGMMSSALAITGIRVNHLTTLGELEGAAETTLATPAPGSGSAVRPAQVACCISLNMGAAFGRSGRGRVYWPSLAGQSISTSTLRMSSTARNAILTDFNAFQAAVADVITTAKGSAPSAELVVFSRKLRKVRLVQNISVGDVLDTQRRRRDSLKEQRSIQPRA